MHQRTIYLSVQTGIVVRDLLRSGVLDGLLAHPDARVVILSPGERDPAFVSELSHPRVVLAPHRPYAPTTMKWRLMTRRWRYARSPRVADLFNRLEERLVDATVYDDLFARYPPALVVSGDPLRPGDTNLVAAARRYGVPSLGSVRSWDNLLKHLRTRPDRLTVWNEVNRSEAIQFERYRPRDVEVVGAPQLDPYFRADGALSREVFCASEGLDPERKILVLATSSALYESDQTYLVDLLLDAIRGGAIRQPVQLVLRTHPDDRVGVYLKYARAPEVTLDLHSRYLATLGWTATVEDIQRTANLLRHADVVVNSATTLTLEAAIFDTPTVQAAFSTIDPEAMDRYVIQPAFARHFKPLLARELTPVAWNGPELVGWINRYLDNRSLHAHQRRQIVRDWVQFTDGQSARRLAAAILRQAGLEPPGEPAPPPEAAVGTPRALAGVG